jgi:hypothetical protein
MNKDESWHRRLYDYLESCHLGEFLTGSHAEVSERLKKEKAKKNYIHPTQTLPDPSPNKCRQDHKGTKTLQCKACKYTTDWEENMYVFTWTS